MQFTLATIAALSTSFMLVSAIPAEQVFARAISCAKGDPKLVSTKAQMREAMGDINPSLVYGFNPPNNFNDYVNCQVSSDNGAGQFCCQMTKRGQHNAAIALVMQNRGGRCPSTNRVFSGQNILDNMNDLLSKCAADSFAGIKDLTDCISLHVGPRGC